MSFWTDLRDTITGPFRAIGGFFGDVFSGKNIFESLGKRAAELGAAVFAPIGHILRIDPIKNLFNKLGPIGQGIENLADTSVDWNRGEDPTWVKFRDTFAIPLVGVGAGVVGFGLAGAGAVASVEGVGLGGTAVGDVLASTVAGLGAYGAANAAERNPLQGLTYIASNTDIDLGIEIPKGVKDTFNDAKDFWENTLKPNLPKQSQAPQKPTAPNTTQITQSGYTTETFSLSENKAPFIFAALVIGAIATDVI